MKNYRNAMRYAAKAFGRGVRVTAALDIHAAHERCQTLQAGIRDAREQLAAHAMAGTGTEQELTALRERIARDVQTYNDISGALQAEEGRRAAGVAAQFNAQMQSGRRAVNEAIGGYFRAVMTGAALTAAAMTALSLPLEIGANPGNGVMPVTVSNELITDIQDDGAFLSAVTVTQIPGLRLPRVKTAVTQTTEALASGAEATEHTMNDDLILFGRYPGRDVISVPSNVLQGTNTDLHGYISAKLQEIHRERLYARALATGAAGQYAHMSVYHGDVGVKTVTGATMYEAIIASLAALPLAARRVAKVAMTSANYYAMIKELANGATPLFGTVDQKVLGFEVVLCENAVKTLVGDLKAIHINYDEALGMKSDENIRIGVTDVVIYGDYDIQVTDAERLRIAAVSA